MTRPEFLIVGAMSSGTSTLHSYLKRKDDVFVPEREVHFFSKEANYRRGVASYESRFEAAKPGQRVGEKSASYHYSPVAPERIHALLPKARLVWIFRDPVERAYAHYWNAVVHGREALSFDDALRAEEERVAEDDTWGYAFRSRYADQVRRYLAFFSREQMLLLTLDELRADPLATLNRLASFLDVAPFASLPERLKSNVRTQIPRSPRLQAAARRALGDKTAAYRLVSRLNARQVASYPPMSGAARGLLHDRLADQVRGLEELIDRPLPAWRPSA